MLVMSSENEHDSDTPDPVTPEARAIGEPTGIPAVMGDGRTWLIARCGLARGLTPIREAIFKSTVLRGVVSGADVLAAAWYGLAINYDLSESELRDLLAATDPSSIVAEVCDAAVPGATGERTFTAWARSALLSNGLPPSSVPADDLPHVLEQLVRTGRAVPLGEYSDAAKSAEKVAGVRRMAEQAIAEQKARLATE